MDNPYPPVSPLATANNASVGASPLAGASELSAYETLMRLAQGDGSPTGVGPGRGMPTGAPSTGNFGRDALGFGRAAGQTALGMVANPGSVPGAVLGGMLAAGVRGLAGLPNPVNVANALGMRGLTNALRGAVRGPTPVEQMFGAQDGSKPGALSPAAAQEQMAQAMANNDMGGPKGGLAKGPAQGYGDYGGGDKGDAAGTGENSESSPGDTGGGDKWAQGGLIALAGGGKIVNGPGGGLDDLIPTTIDGRRAAALSDGEFVIPADVVSMMGDGSSRAGAQRLYDFMRTIREHKTGTSQQAGPLPVGDILKRTLR